MIDNNSIIIKGIIGEDYTYSDFIDDLRSYNTTKRKNIRIGIDSLGGYIDENDKIYNKILELKKTRTITTYNLGNCMSCASILFVTGDIRIFDFAKGNFLIHSPWVEINGDASQLRKAASDLQKVEDKIALLYAKVGKSDISEIKNVMDEDRNLTPAEVKKFKFATEIKNAEVASSQVMSDKKVYAFAALCKDFDIKMQEKRNIHKNNNKRMKVLDFVKTLLKISEIKNLVVTAADGVDYTVTNADESEDLKIGSNITIEGQPYEGQIILADDTVITVEGGIVTKIEQPEEEVKPEEQANTETETKNEETAEPKNEDPVEPQETPNQELEDLKVKVDELFGMVTTLAERLNSLEGEKAEVEDMKNKIRNLVSTENAQATAQTQEEQGKQYHFHFKK